MATPDDLESRLTAVEREVALLREQQAFTASDVAAARTLAAGADRDVSEVRAELRAHTSTLNALRETQVDFSLQLRNFGQRLDAHSERLDAHGHRIDDGFQTVTAGLAHIVDLLGRDS